MQSPEMEQALRMFRGKLQAMRIGRELVSRQLGEIWQIVQGVRPDIIVYHPKVAAATYFARAIGATAIPGFRQPGIMPTKHLPPILLAFPDLSQIGNRVSNAMVAQHEAAEAIAKTMIVEGGAAQAVEVVTKGLGDL